MLNVKEFKEVLKQIKLQALGREIINGEKLLESINQYLMRGETDISVCDLPYTVNEGVVELIRKEVFNHGFAIWLDGHSMFSYLRVKPLEDLSRITRWYYKHTNKL